MTNRKQLAKAEMPDSAKIPNGLRARRESVPNKAVGGVASWLMKIGLSSWLLIGVAIIVAGIVIGLVRVLPVFVAVFVSLVFTALLNPVVNLLSKWISRWLAVIIAILGSFALFSGMMTFVVTSVTGQWSTLGQQLNNGVDKIIEFLDKLPFQYQLTSDEVNKWIDTLVNRGQTYLTENWQTLAGEVLSNAGNVAIFFTILALSVFVTIFFLHSGESMWVWFLNLLPARSRLTTNRAAQAGWNSFGGYARGTVIIALTDGAMAWIFLTIIQVPLAPALGVLVMIGAFIPMVGAPAAMLVAMIVALAVGGVGKAVLVGIGIALIGQLEGHVLQPLIMGHQVSLHPIVVGIGVVAGTLLGGLLGAMVIIPILGVLWAIFDALYRRDTPISREWLHQDPSPPPVEIERPALPLMPKRLAKS